MEITAIIIVGVVLVFLIGILCGCIISDNTDPLYQTRDPLVFEIQKIPRVESIKEAQEKYGEHYQIIDALIGKMNEVIDEVNNPTIKRTK